jgi:segregation and condensation protein B
VFWEAELQSFRSLEAAALRDNEDGDSLARDGAGPRSDPTAANMVAALRALEDAGAEPADALMREAVRVAEAIVFAASEPVAESVIAERLPDGVGVADVLARLAKDYESRGVSLVRIGDGWRFRTADDLAYLLQTEQVEQRKLSRAALETLAIIAYHQPVTRAEIEDIRGVSLSRGVLDVLLELGWIRIRGRRRTPGRPLTFGSTDVFLDHFGLESLKDLPGKDDLKGAGLLDPALPLDFSMPQTDDHPDLTADEDPLEADDPELSLHPQLEPEAGDRIEAVEEDTEDAGEYFQPSAGSEPGETVADGGGPDDAQQAIGSVQDEAALERIRDAVLRQD